MKKKHIWIYRLVFALLITFGATAIYSILNNLIDLTFNNYFGISSQLTQSLLTLGIVLAVLLILGFSVKKSINKLVGVN